MPEGAKTLVILLLFSVLFPSSVFAKDIEEPTSGQDNLLKCPADMNLHHVTYGERLSELPIDAMGTDFRQMMEDLSQSLHPSATDLEELALSIFVARLDLSKKYKTRFADYMEPGWQTNTPRTVYLNRWNGAPHLNSWSFGLEGHERAKQVCSTFNSRLGKSDDVLAHIPIEKINIAGDLSPTDKTAVRSWTFSFSYEGQSFNFSVYQDDKGSYFFHHLESDKMLVARTILKKMWANILNEKLGFENRVRALAQFEWFWFWCNPFGRAGASVGDTLSMLVQKQMHEAHLPIVIRNEYINLDLIALSSPYEKYTEKRVIELTRP